MNSFRFALVAILLTPSLHAQVPRLISYQGRVAVGAVNFDGSGQFKFALVDNTGATTYWSNDGTSVAGSQPAAAVTLPVSKGLYSVLLGDVALANMSALPASVFTQPDVRLRVWFNDGVNGSQLLSPDQRLASSAYLASGSVTAETIADGTISAAKIAAGAIDGTRVAPASLDFSRLNVPSPPTAGQVLGFDGASLKWSAPATGGDSVFSLSGTSAWYSAGNVGIGTSSPASKLDVRGSLVLENSGDPAIFTGTGNTELNRYVALLNSPGHLSASGLKAGGVLVADSYSYASPGKNDLIVKGNVGIGTASPFAPLHVDVDWGPTGVPNINLTGRNPTVKWNSSPGFPFFGEHFSWIAHVGSSRGLEFWHRYENLSTLPFLDSGWQSKVTLTTDGDINYVGRLGKLDTAEHFAATLRAADFLLGHSGRRGAPGRALVDWNDGAGRKALIVNFASDWPETIIGGNATEVRTLRITGGADLAEPFAMSQHDVPPGADVVIDEENPGRLRMSHVAYDRRFAGVVSGANGIQPGISMIQQDVLEAGKNVALSGRVHVRANTSGDPIKPGDLLTTSGVPGEAMKASDYPRAQGAILGKAMTGLRDGSGSVLELVTLQ